MKYSRRGGKRQAKNNGDSSTTRTQDSESKMDISNIDPTKSSNMASEPDLSPPTPRESI